MSSSKDTVDAHYAQKWKLACGNIQRYYEISDAITKRKKYIENKQAVIRRQALVPDRNVIYSSIGNGTKIHVTTSRDKSPSPQRDDYCTLASRTTNVT
jgi:hypothetical protein